MDKKHFFSFAIILLCVSECSSASAMKTYYMEELCGPHSTSATIEVAPTSDGPRSSGIVRTGKHGSYASHFTCAVNLKPSQGNGVVVAIRKINFRPLCLDKLTLRNTEGHEGVLCSFLSDSTESKTFYSDGKMILNFSSSSLHGFTRRGFELTFTAFRVGPCASEEYDCHDRHCISRTLVCDGHNHCGNGKGQFQCSHTEGVVHKDFVTVGILVASTFLTFAVVVGITYCCVCSTRLKHTVIIMRQPENHYGAYTPIQPPAMTQGVRNPVLSYGSISPPSKGHYCSATFIVKANP